MSKDKTEGSPKKKGKGLLMMLVLCLVMVGVGGGTAFALVKAGVIGGAKPHEDNSPKLVKKGDTDPFAPKAEGGKEAGPEVDGEGGSPYRTAYYGFADDFTSNLADSTALIQVSLACSTHRDGRVLMWLKKHELAERSAVLAVLADTPQAEVVTIPGKAKLQERLAQAINRVLIDNEGFGGVDRVYFKTLLVQ